MALHHGDDITIKVFDTRVCFVIIEMVEYINVKFKYSKNIQSMHNPLSFTFNGNGNVSGTSHNIMWSWKMNVWVCKCVRNYGQERPSGQLQAQQKSFCWNSIIFWS